MVKGIESFEELTTLLIYYLAVHWVSISWFLLFNL